MESIDTASEFAHETIDKIADAAKETFGEKGERLSDAEQKMINDLREFIHDNPITSVGIAVATGFILSRLLVNR
ncbi:MAG: DUF883 domain-containing protein [Methylobacter sp.]|jgi:ElaB/YqjD/DUF883 family membrane-anchored ribosome-binding protein|uniref:DUF883 C-terminal domain-containing protein n=1 Tax=Methylobacter sp. TaxID=2051955 RepID=UPI0025D236AC|nr:DUF883 C-terminal domain-containing protein [Methylobacter sp.]MCK9619213.1 DUF883 domain-containing protein [Methylobacter sp.]